MGRHGTSRFAITDLSVLLAVLMLAAGALVTPVSRLSRESANLVKCASNLRQVGQAMLMYATANKGRLPRTVYDGQGSAPVFYTGVNAPNPFGPGGPGPNDMTAAAFLLIRATEIGPDAFLCPIASVGAAWDFGGSTRDKVSNFPDRQFLGYSFTNPYPTPAAVTSGFKYDYTLTSDFPLAADINPGLPGVVAVTPTSARREMASSNSPNHNGDGQNVLYADGHVEHQIKPFCGMLRTERGTGPSSAYRDNIYTFGAGFGGAGSIGVVGAPVDASDSVLLPVAPEGAARLRGDRQTTFLLGGVIAAGVIAAVVILVSRLRAKFASAPPHDRAGGH